MSELQIALPKKLRSFVDDRAAKAGCSPSTFVTQLLQHYQQSEELRRLEQFLMVGVRHLDQGEAREVTKADFKRLHGRVARKAKGRKQ